MQNSNHHLTFPKGRAGAMSMCGGRYGGARGATVNDTLRNGTCTTNSRTWNNGTLNSGTLNSRTLNSGTFNSGTWNNAMVL